MARRIGWREGGEAMEQEEQAAKTAVGEGGQTPAEADRCRKTMGRVRQDTGFAVLFTAMGAMMALVLMDVFFTLRSELVSNAFEAFKLIAVTVLGYIFGANQPRNKDE